MAYNDVGIFMHQVYTSMTRNLQLQLIDSYHHLNAQSIDKCVELEMQRLRADYAHAEEHYVQQMLQQNPVVVERRANATPRRSGSSSDETQHGEAAQTQQQRAESCRKSRINNKIKKAKSKFRHKFSSQKLAQSAHALEYMRELIAQTENQLLCNGYQKMTLQKLRQAYGLDRCKEDLTELKQITDIIDLC